MPAGSKAALMRRIRSMPTGGAVAMQFVALQLADAVLGGDRSAELAHQPVHRLVHGPVERQEGVRVAAVRLRNVVVQIAVAHVAEAGDARLRRDARPRRRPRA